MAPSTYATARVGYSGTMTGSTGDDPFGNRTAGSANPGTTTYRGYQNNWTDPTSGTVYMGARWYDPTLGRFLTHDTMPAEAGTSDSTNPYTYGGANPVNRIDPSGHTAIPIGEIGGINWGSLIGGVGAALGGIGAIGEGILDGAAIVAGVVLAPEVLVAAAAFGVVAIAVIAINYANEHAAIGATGAQQGNSGHISHAGGPNSQTTTTLTPTQPPPPLDPPINPLRPGWTVTQSATSASTGSNLVNAVALATSTAAVGCGLGDSIAACQTPTAGIQSCAGLFPSAALCAPASPAPGSPGATRNNLPMSEAQSQQASSAAKGNPQDPDRCSPAERIRGACRDDAAPNPPPPKPAEPSRQANRARPADREN